MAVKDKEPDLKEVKILFPLAGPGIGPYPAGEIVKLPVTLANDLLNTKQAVLPEAEINLQGVDPSLPPQEQPEKEKK